MVDECRHNYRVTGQPQRANSLFLPVDSARETLVTVSAHKASPLTQPSTYSTYFFQARSYYGPGQHRTHHVAQASLKLSAILQPLPLECWGISHTSTPLPTSDTYFWNQFLGTGGMWLLVDPQPLHQDRIQPQLPTSVSKNYTPI